MSVSASQNLQAIANELIIGPGGDKISGGLFQTTTLFDKIINGSKATEVVAGGSGVKLHMQVAKHDVGYGSSLYVNAATSAADLYRKLSFTFDRYTASDLVSHVEIKQSSSNSEAVNMLKAKIQSLRNAIRDQINANFWTGNGSNNDTGLPSFWYGSTYGGVTRASFPLAFASNNAYSYTIGSAAASRAQTYWDVQGTTVTDAQYVQAISELYNHVGESGRDPDFVCVSKNGYARLLSYMNSVGSGNKFGLTQSVTANGGQGLQFFGAEVVRDANIPTGTVFVLNTEYIHFAGVNGFLPSNIAPQVHENSMNVIDTSVINASCDMTVICSDTTRQGWMINLGV